MSDGSAGDADYGRIGASYARYRRTEPAILARIVAALGDARHVVNVGAGAGSYEPADREVVAVEPSATMRAQRPPGRPAIPAVAEALPFADDAFDAAMAIVTVHQWQDLEQGLAELRRVTTGPVVILTCDPQAPPAGWLADYAPEVIATERRRFPAIDRLAEGLGGRVRVEAVPVPLRCVDGFNEAYYGRPEGLLVPEARLACSSWSFLSAEATARFEARLRADLASGAWDAKWGHLRRQAWLEESPLRLVVGERG